MAPSDTPLPFPAVLPHAPHLLNNSSSLNASPTHRQLFSHPPSSRSNPFTRHRKPRPPPLPPQSSVAFSHQIRSNILLLRGRLSPCAGVSFELRTKPARWRLLSPIHQTEPTSSDVSLFSSAAGTPRSRDAKGYLTFCRPSRRHDHISRERVT